MMNLDSVCFLIVFLVELLKSLVPTWHFSDSIFSSKRVVGW
jgi:hypothetical protein